jgi:hypothetical protein
MDSNELRDYVRELNKREAHEHELRRQQALNKIKELRKQLKEKSDGTNIHQRIPG